MRRAIGCKEGKCEGSKHPHSTVDIPNMYHNNLHSIEHSDGTEHLYGIEHPHDTEDRL